MKFRSNPPDPSEFPKIRLIWPAVLFLMFFVGGRTGYVWKIPGATEYLLDVILGTAVVGLFTSALALGGVVPALRHHASLRTVGNLASAGVAVAFVLFVLFAFVHSLYWQ